MLLRLALVSLVLSLPACELVHQTTSVPPAYAKPMREQDGTPTYHIDCHYEMSHCERKARDACHGDYDVLGRGSHVCEDCGYSLGDAPGSPVWFGTLEVRCH